jgi:hypothetical protein
MLAVLAVAFAACRSSPWLRQHHGVTGSLLITDVATGEIVRADGDIDARVLPLSVVKLYTAALWWEHELDDSALMDPRIGHVTVTDVVAQSLDLPGAMMAVELRQRFGEQVILTELHRLGLDPAPGSDDTAWGETMSIGEHGVTVTMRGVAEFLRSIATGTNMKRQTAYRLRVAMIATVVGGTARYQAEWLQGTGRTLGGKTGTGPVNQQPYDGWFAGIIFKAGVPRYIICIHSVRGGGGIQAARIAASIARDLP